MVTQKNDNNNELLLLLANEILIKYELTVNSLAFKIKQNRQ